MKISKAQKTKNRNKIITSAVDIMIAKGFQKATMREIAKHAGMGDATIYNYFSTKESILYAYYEERIKDTIKHLKLIDKFNEYTFQEQLQTFFETELDLFLQDREFVQKTFKTVFFALSSNFSRLRPIRNRFMDVINDIFDAAVQAGEIQEQLFQEMTYQLFWEYYIAIVLYWLHDTSDQFSETSVLIDKSLDLTCAVIRSGIGNKMFDMGTLLFKNHILGRLEFFKEKTDMLHKIKREFMGDNNG